MTIITPDSNASNIRPQNRPWPTSRDQTPARGHALRRAQTVEKGHGRIEIRRCAASAEVVPHLNWPGAAQVVRIERLREIAGKTTAEIVYCVTSLTAAEADPRRLLDLARALWGIENKLHWRRDVSMNEDRCRVRAGARALAALRNLVLSMLRSTDASVPAPAKPMLATVPPRSRP
ncbi:MAG: ISAs1 family transposase [Rhodomicrobium sp.]|nr:ISAs1 family transposase [Rhodomicrobium sp.]